MTGSRLVYRVAESRESLPARARARSRDDTRSTRLSRAAARTQKASVVLATVVLATVVVATVEREGRYEAAATGRCAR